jgi:secreted trypsin-like serine protease
MVGLLAGLQGANRRGAAPIIGGTQTNSAALSSIAYIVYLPRSKGVIQCTGTVIAARWILTAGHCGVEPGTGQRNPPSGFRVLTERTAGITTRYQVSGVTQVVGYPGYGRSVFGPDAALLRLSNRVSVKPVNVASATTPPIRSGTHAVIAGWATNYNEQKIPSTMAVAATIIQSASWCDVHVFRFNSRRELCTIESENGGTGVCAGESGGPLLVFGGSGEPVEVGIASRTADHCSTRRPDTFTMVAAISGWLRKWTRR